MITLELLEGLRIERFGELNEIEVERVRARTIQRERAFQSFSQCALSQKTLDFGYQRVVSINIESKQRKKTRTTR